MTSIPLTIPRPVPTQRVRPPKKNIPQTSIERTHILHVVRNYVAEFAPVPPLPTSQLKEHADRVVGMLKCDPIYRDYIGVLINNEMWRESLASIPYERRLLLLPKCLRVENKCPAPFDEFGLLCKQCGLCSIQDLQAEAERLGYAVLVAEGSAIVMSIIETGKIEGIVGVSCLSVLERAFPYMEAAAIPGVAIPLLQDDCIDTTVDLDWIWDYIHLTGDDKTRRLDLGALREEVDFWFTHATLDLVMGPADGETEKIARDWLMRAGKRWRPFLTVAAFQALRRDTGATLPEDIRKVALAVECFHKASLIHDDIEDNDRTRYGEKTLHEEFGVPVALNVGDLLIGEGYRLLAACKVSAEQKARMIQVASHGQRELCRGQGAELCWARQPAPLTTVQVLDIFRKKTAPAFEVALRLGALYAGEEAHDEASEVFSAYSEALGIAYQIRDDLSDLGSEGETNDIAGLRPSLLLAVAYERASGENKTLLESVWRRTLKSAASVPLAGASEGITPASMSNAPANSLILTAAPPFRQDAGSTLSNGLSVQQIEALYAELKADERTNSLLETYKEEAIRSLREVENANLKGLLRRVIGKIFNDTEIKGWCKEFEQKNGVEPTSSSAESPSRIPVMA